MHEYKMTYMLRILSTITLLPLGIILILCGYDPGEDASTKTILMLYGFGFAFIITTLLVWAHSMKKLVILNDNSISVTSLFGTKAIKIEKGTRITHDSIKVVSGQEGGFVGVALGGLVTGLIVVAASKQGEAATTNIKITIANEKSRICLNSNIKGIVQLRDKIIDIENKHILPDIKMKFGNGEILNFGSVIIKNGVIHVGKKSLNISDLASIEVKGDRLFIRNSENKKPISIYTNRIENMYSLLGLLSFVASPKVA